MKTKPATLTFSTFFTLLFLTHLCVAAHGQETAPAPEPPEIARSIPAVASPGTAIELEGHRLGAEDGEKVRILFLQGGVEQSASKSGSGWDNSNLKKGRQHYNVLVPEGVVDGPCQIVVEVGGVRSRPFTIEIKTLVTPPVLIDLHPRWVVEGEMVWINGTGYGEGDTLELVDSSGKTHQLGDLGKSSSAHTAAFPLPAGLPEGEAVIRVIEHRSDMRQRSNSLSFMISRDPVPLYIFAGWLRPVAPGQWLELIVSSYRPLERAERVEVRFKQNELLLTSSIKRPKDLRVQVPDTLAPGTVEIQTRTWVAGTASAWSDPVSYQLIDKPAAAHIYSLQLVPERAEAAFIEQEKIVAIAPIVIDEETQVRVPDKISPESIKVMTRMWRGGRASQWSAPGEFGIASDSPDRVLQLSPLTGVVYLNPAASPKFTVYPGESLMMEGKFPASSGKLEMVLESSGRIVRLPCRAVTRPTAMKVTIPRNLEPGDWSISIHSSEDSTNTNLPIRLRIKTRADGAAPYSAGQEQPN